MKLRKGDTMDLTVRWVLWTLSAVALVWAITLQACREPRDPSPTSTGRPGGDEVRATCAARCEPNGGMDSVETSIFGRGSCTCENELFLTGVPSRADCAEHCAPNGGVDWYSPPKAACFCQNGGLFEIELPDTGEPTPAPSTPAAPQEPEVYYYYLEPDSPEPPASTPCPGRVA